MPHHQNHAEGSMSGEAHRREHRTIDADTTELELVQHLARHLRRGSAVETSEWGLSPHQARALSVIARSESRHHRHHTSADRTTGGGTDDNVPGIRLGALADWLQVTPRSVTEVVDALEGLDLVARSPDPADRRAVQVHLTDHGRQTARAIRAARRAQTESILDELSPEERAQLRASLLTLIEAAEH